MIEAAWGGLLDEARPQRHVVQFYEADEAALVENVTRYIVEGLRRDEGVLIAATAQHNAAFAEAIDDIDAASSRVRFLDAERIAAQLRSDAVVDWERFDETVDDAIEDLRDAGAEGVRVYGEIVGVLWQRGDLFAALDVEQHWEPLIERHQAMLYCGYPIDVFGDEFRVGEMDPLLCAHSHMLPTGHAQRIDDAVERAMHEVLGERAEGLRFLIRANFRPAWAVVPRAEATILWLRNNVPDYADEILRRARRYYRAG